MALSNSLITAFVKATNDTSSSSSSSTVYGTVASYDGKYYVKIDGSDALTPVTLTTEVSVGDRIQVTISNHTATVTSNITSPSASTATTSALSDSVDSLSDSLDSIVASSVTTTYLEAVLAEISELYATTATVEDLSATVATIEEAYISTAEVTTLLASYATIESLSADLAQIEYLATTVANIQTAYITYAEVNSLLAEYATVESLEAYVAEISSLSATYAEIDFANIDVASIVTGFVSDLLIAQGLVSDAVTAASATVTGYLTSIGIVADSITAGTLDCGSITVTNLDVANLTVTNINGITLCDGTVSADNLEEVLLALAAAINTNDDAIAEVLEEAGLVSTTLEQLSEEVIVSVVTYFYKSTSSTELSDGSWTTNSPTWEEGYYIWTRTLTTYGNGSKVYSSAVCITGNTGATGETGETGSDGEDGVGIESIANYYGLSSDSTVEPEEWLDTIPTLTSINKYLWNYEIITYTDETATSIEPHIIGVYGESGTSIESVTEYYALSRYSDVIPEGGNVLDSSGTDILDSDGEIIADSDSWSTEPQTIDSIWKYLWNYEVILYTDGTVEETDRRVIGAYGDTGDTGETGSDGEDGVGVDEITEYYAVSESNTEEPTEWSTDIPELTVINKYLWNYEVVSYSDGEEVTTTPHVVGVYGDTGETGADGSDGVSVESITEYYAISKSSETAPSGGNILDSDGEDILDADSNIIADSDSWSTTVPIINSTYRYLWNYEVVVYSDGTTSETSKRVIGVYGDTGDTGAQGEKGDDGTSVTIKGSLDSEDDLPTEGNESGDGYLIDGELYVYDPSSDSFVNVGTIQGPAGEDGEDGVGIESITNYYAVSESNATSPSSWSTTVPEMTETLRYLWNYEVTIYTNSLSESTTPHVIGVYGQTGATGADGSDGVGVESITEYYAVSTSGTEFPTEWLDTIPSLTSTNKYLWNYEVTTYTDGTTTSTDPHVVGVYGDTGETGSTGNGIYSIINYYGVSTDSSTEPSTWDENVPSLTSTNKYLWNYEVTTYTDGTTTSTDPHVVGVYGDTGETGETGATGADGTSITSVVEYYALSNTTTCPDGGTVTDSSGSDILDSDNDTILDSYAWTTDVPVMTTSFRYLWNYEIIYYSDGSYTETDRRIIGVYGTTGDTGESGADGEDGVGISQIIEYYAVSDSGDTAPTSWSTDIPTLTSTNKYLWDYELIIYTDGTTDTTTPHVVGVYGDTGDAGETGVGISSITEYYAVSSSSDTAPSDSEFDVAIPEMTSEERYLWNYEVVTYTNDDTETTDKRVIGVYGDTGETGADGSDGVTLYATSTTSASSAAKTATLVDGSVEIDSLYAGLTVVVMFTYANSAVVNGDDILDSDGNVILDSYGIDILDSYSYANTLTLNLNSLGAKTIYLNNSAIGPENEFFWSAGATVMFIYTGSVWMVADSGTYSEITTVTSIATEKSTVYYAASAPSESSFDLQENDVWFDTDDGNLMYMWDGTGWVPQEFGTSAISARSITAELLAANSVVASKIAAEAVTADKIAANSITATQIAASSITGTEIAANTITGDLIAAETITADNIAVGTITGDLIAAETITADNIVSATITSTQIAASTIIGSNIAANTITADNIVAGTITATELSSGSVTAEKIDVTDLYALGATIGGFSISSSAIYSSANANTYGASSGIYLGSSGLSITSAFTVSSSGALTATSATISGSITATSGTIGGFSIGSSSIYTSANANTYGASSGIYLGSSGLSITSAFTVSSSGALTATSATISGTLTAGSGSTIGGWTATTGKIYSGDSSTGVAVIQAPSDSITYCFAAGGTSHSSYSDCPFRVTKTGVLYASSAVIDGDLKVETQNKIKFIDNEGTGNGYIWVNSSNSLVFNGQDCPLVIYSEMGLTLGSSSYDTVLRGQSIEHTGIAMFDSTTEFYNSTNMERSSGMTTHTISRTDTSSTISVGIGSGGYNRGLYDGGCGHWFIYMDEDDFIYVGTGEHSIYMRYNTRPSSSGDYYLGSSSYLWKGVYASSGTVSTSDQRVKTDITEIDSASAINFINAINPVTYKLVNGDSGRTHWGMIAQDVEQSLSDLSMSSSDFAGFIKTPIDENNEDLSYDEEENAVDYVYGLRYEEFIAPLIKVVQSQQEEIESLKEEVSVLKAAIN